MEHPKPTDRIVDQTGDESVAKLKDIGVKEQRVSRTRTPLISFECDD